MCLPTAMSVAPGGYKWWSYSTRKQSFHGLVFEFLYSSLGRQIRELMWSLGYCAFEN